MRWLDLLQPHEASLSVPAYTDWPVDMTPVVSRHLVAVGYDPAVGEIRILFRNGGLFAYQVPLGIFEGLMGAPSKGRYFAYRIRWRYRGSRVN